MPSRHRLDWEVPSRGRSPNLGSGELTTQLLTFFHTFRVEFSYHVSCIHVPRNAVGGVFGFPEVNVLFESCA
jgi:hypothetical protein